MSGIASRATHLIGSDNTAASGAVQTFQSGSALVMAPGSTFTLYPQVQKKFYAGPTSGADAAPTFRVIAVADVPTLNQDTTGSAAKWTTARNLAGNSVDGSGNVAFANKFIVQGTADAGLSAAQFLGALDTGIVKNTTTTGVLSIAAAASDYVAPSAYASANGLTMSTARLLGRTTAASGAAEEITVSTGLTLSSGALTVNTSQNITKLSNLTSNGFVTTTSGDGTLVVTSAAAFTSGTLSGLTGLAIRDTSAAFDVTLAATSSTTLTAGRILTFDVVNAARTIKLSGNPTLADWFDQSVKTTATPSFSAITSTVATGTAPLTVTSTTVVGNLNVSQLLGATWVAPGTIGSGTPSTGAFTTLSTTGAINATGPSATANALVSTGNVTANGASRITVDYAAGPVGRVLCWGPNAATTGVLQLGVLSSDASILNLSVCSITPTGLAVTGVVDINGTAASATASHLQLGSTTQSTIGANGAASALTANPLGYLSAYLGSTHIIIPYYNA